MLHLRIFIGATLSAMLLTGCGGNNLVTPSASTSTGTSPPHPPRGSRVFRFTGAEQRFKVPAGVTHVTITASGASGGTCGYTSYCYLFGGSGKGGLVKATISVTPAETLYVYVGGQNGFNGGGAGNGSPFAVNGGGASDVRQGGRRAKDRIIVAGGGGAGGLAVFDSSGSGGAGGAGGGKVAAPGANGQGSGAADGGGGGGGTQAAGGAPGTGGQCQYYCSQYVKRKNVKPACRECGGGNGVGGLPGIFFSGGAPGVGGGSSAGGGGGGWYGGGGGGSGAWAYYGPSYSDGAGGGGGGGSSFIEKSAVRLKNRQGGAAPGDGRIVITW